MLAKMVNPLCFYSLGLFLLKISWSPFGSVKAAHILRLGCFFKAGASGRTNFSPCFSVYIRFCFRAAAQFDVLIPTVIMIISKMIIRDTMQQAGFLYPSESFQDSQLFWHCLRVCVYILVHIRQEWMDLSSFDNGFKSKDTLITSIKRCLSG